MLYKTIVGSRTYGIEIPSSDIDISHCGNSVTQYKSSFKSGNNLLETPTSQFLEHMLSDKPIWYFTQWLFPSEILEDNLLSQYIQENKEEIIAARLPIAYHTLSKKAERLYYCADRIYKKFPKRMAYSTLLYSILANYTDGMTFAKAHTPEGELHDFLIAMRLGQVPLEDAIARNEFERKRAEKAAGFYKEAIHPEILMEFEQIILEEANK